MAEVSHIGRLAGQLATVAIQLDAEVASGGDLPLCMELAGQAESIAATLSCAFSSLDEIISAQVEAQFGQPTAALEAA